METADAFRLISTAIDTGHAAHGYLIVGDIQGNASELVEMILLKLFPNAPEQIESKGHPDVIYLEPEGAKRIISVKSMREKLVLPMATTAFSGGWKVGVILGADRMEAPSANAFLKSLEEPPPKTLYLLLTDAPDGILPTIISRAQRINLPLSTDTLEDEVVEEMRELLLTRNASELAGLFEGLKGDDSAAVDFSAVRKSFFKTLMGFVRGWMVNQELPYYQAFRNVNAVEDAYRQSARSMNSEAVLSLMLDRLVFPSSKP